MVLFYFNNISDFIAMDSNLILLNLYVFLYEILKETNKQGCTYLSVRLYVRLSTVFHPLNARTDSCKWPKVRADLHI
jgi:hypothetical protein